MSKLRKLDHQVTGRGVDISTVFIGSARARAAELGVADRVTFIHGAASGYVAAQPAGIVSCVGATWIGGGVAGGESYCLAHHLSVDAACSPLRFGRVLQAVTRPARVGPSAAEALRRRNLRWRTGLDQGRRPRR